MQLFLLQTLEAPIVDQEDIEIIVESLFCYQSDGHVLLINIQPEIDIPQNWRIVSDYNQKETISAYI